METVFLGIAENSIQIVLMERMAKKLGLSVDAIAEHWIDLYSEIFRRIWESGERDIDTIEEKIYRPDPLASNYSQMVASILIHTIDPSLTK